MKSKLTRYDIAINGVDYCVTFTKDMTYNIYRLEENNMILIHSGQCERDEEPLIIASDWIRKRQGKTISVTSDKGEVREIKI